MACGTHCPSSDRAKPWLRKYPFMSLWLSATNRLAGSIRRQTTVEATPAVIPDNHEHDRLVDPEDARRARPSPFTLNIEV